VHLANLRDRTEVLFYRLLTEHISDMLSVGTAIQRLSREFRRGRGVHSSAAHLDQVETVLRETV
jgi:malate dehydrogenase (oxaloacetate-decarboxylating)